MNSRAIFLLVLILYSPAGAWAVSPSTQLDRCAQLEARLDLAGALAAYESLAQTGSDEVAFRAALRAAELGQALHGRSRAARWLVWAARMSPGDKRAVSLLTRAGELYRQAGDLYKARWALLPILKEDPMASLRPTTTERLRAQLSLARIDLLTGREKEALIALKRLVKQVAGARPAERESLDEIAARSSVLLIQNQVDSIDWSYPLTLNPKALKKCLSRLMVRVQECTGSLEGVMEKGHVPSKLKALLLYGRLHARFGGWLVDSPPPPGLEPEHLELYRQALAEQSHSFFDKSHSALLKVLDIAARYHTGYHHLALARAELAQLPQRGGSELRQPFWSLRGPEHGLLPKSGPAASALARARLALADRPGDEEQLLLAAEGLLVGGRPSQARYILEHLVQPTLSQSLLLVCVLRAQEELDTAYLIPSDLVWEDPHLASAWLLIAGFYIDYGDLIGLERTVRAFRELRIPGLADSATWYVLHGIVCFGRGDPVAARAAFLHALSEGGQSDVALSNLGLLLLLDRSTEGAGPDHVRLENLRRAVHYFESVTLRDDRVQAALDDARAEIKAIVSAQEFGERDSKRI